MNERDVTKLYATVESLQKLFSPGGVAAIFRELGFNPKPVLHSAFNPGRVAVTANTEGPSMTRQEFADECDINVLMARYEKNGFPPVSRPDPVYMDCTSIPSDFRDILDYMASAEECFMQLPANVRKEFENDPREFVEYATDPANLDQMRKWGLAKPEAAAPPVMKVEVVNAAVPAPDAGGASKG